MYAIVFLLKKKKKYQKSPVVLIIKTVFFAYLFKLIGFFSPAAVSVNN